MSDDNEVIERSADEPAVFGLLFDRTCAEHPSLCGAFDEDGWGCPTRGPRLPGDALRSLRNRAAAIASGGCRGHPTTPSAARLSGHVLVFGRVDFTPGARDWSFEERVLGFGAVDVASW